VAEMFHPKFNAQIGYLLLPPVLAVLCYRSAEGRRCAWRPTSCRIEAEGWCVGKRSMELFRNIERAVGILPEKPNRISHITNVRLESNYPSQLPRKGANDGETLRRRATAAPLDHMTGTPPLVEETAPAKPNKSVGNHPIPPCRGEQWDSSIVWVQILHPLSPSSTIRLPIRDFAGRSLVLRRRTDPGVALQNHTTQQASTLFGHRQHGLPVARAFALPAGEEARRWMEASGRAPNLRSSTPRPIIPHMSA